MGVHRLNGTLRPVIFLDRDGVINEVKLINSKPYPPSNADEVVLIDGIRETVTKLLELGFRLIIVTNQPDVARGRQIKSEVEAINNVIRMSIPIDEIRVCYHDIEDNCECRKPKPGLLLHDSGNIDFTRSYMIGDRSKDIEAGLRANCRTIFIDYNYSEPKPSFSHHTISSVQHILPTIIGDLIND